MTHSILWSIKQSSIHFICWGMNPLYNTCSLFSLRFESWDFALYNNDKHSSNRWCITVLSGATVGVFLLRAWSVLSREYYSVTILGTRLSLFFCKSSNIYLFLNTSKIVEKVKECKSLQRKVRAIIAPLSWRIVNHKSNQPSQFSFLLRFPLNWK